MPSAHSQVMPKKCVTCHMHTEEKEKEEKAGVPLQKGGHTFRSNEKVCLKCHEDSKSLMAKWQAEASSLLKRLKALLDSTPDKTSESYKAAKLNYDIVIADGEMGLHNPKYARALLQYGISCLTVESVWEP